MSISFRWLGVAGIEIATGGQVLLIDPYLTRIPLYKAYFGRIKPDMTAVRRIEKCNYVLVTHSHFDHLLDVPPIVAGTGATAAGSPNTKRLLLSLGIPSDRVQTVKPGDTLSPGKFSIRVFPCEHVWVPGYTPGQLSPVLKPPLKARDYRMDIGYCYHVSAGEVTFVTDPGIDPLVNLRADILFTHPGHDGVYYRRLFEQVKPKAVIPIHWDNFFRLGEPRPYFSPPAFKWPPFKRINLKDFAEMIHNIAPGVKVILPHPFTFYEVEDLLQSSRA